MNDPIEDILDLIYVEDVTINVTSDLEPYYEVDINGTIYEEYYE